MTRLKTRLQGIRKWLREQGEKSEMFKGSKENFYTRPPPHVWNPDMILVYGSQCDLAGSETDLS